MSKCYGFPEGMKEKIMNDKQDELVFQLAFARGACVMLRRSAPGSDDYNKAIARLYEAFKALDDRGVFHEIDALSDYEPAEDTLQRHAAKNAPQLDPAEWGDMAGVSPVGHVGESYPHP